MADEIKSEIPETTVKVVADDSKSKARIKELEVEICSQQDLVTSLTGELTGLKATIEKASKTPLPANPIKSVWEYVEEMIGLSDE